MPTIHLFIFIFFSVDTRSSAKKHDGLVTWKKLQKKKNAYFQKNKYSREMYRSSVVVYKTTITNRRYV